MLYMSCCCTCMHTSLGYGNSFKEFISKMHYINVTGSGKTSLIAYVSRVDFPPRTQSYMNKLLISQSQLARLAFAGCFSQAQWWSVLVLCGVNGALVSLEMAVCGSTAPWCWIKNFAVNILSVFRLEWPILSLIHPDTFHFKFKHPLTLLLGPHLPPLLELTSYSQPHFKNYLKWQESWLFATCTVDTLEGKELV